jgi:hypothetical protein
MLSLCTRLPLTVLWVVVYGDDGIQSLVQQVTRIVWHNKLSNFPTQTHGEMDFRTPSFSRHTKTAPPIAFLCGLFQGNVRIWVKPAFFLEVSTGLLRG